MASFDLAANLRESRTGRCICGTHLFWGEGIETCLTDSHKWRMKNLSVYERLEFPYTLVGAEWRTLAVKAGVPFRDIDDCYIVPDWVGIMLECFVHPDEPDEEAVFFLRCAKVSRRFREIAMSKNGPWNIRDYYTRSYKWTGRWPVSRFVREFLRRLASVNV